MSERRFSPLVVALTVPAVVFGPLLACGTSKKATPDGHIVVIDSPTGGGSDAPAAACTASASYGAATLNGSAASAENIPAGGTPPHKQIQFFLAPITGTTPVDALDIELYAGYGALGSGSAIVPGTYQITAAGGDDTYSTCGLCVLLWTDIQALGSNGINPTDNYIATGGTVTLTATGSGSGGSLTGTVSNLTFAHVANMVGSDGFNNASDTVVPGCTSSITSASFTAPLTQVAPFMGKNGIGRPLRLTNRHL